MDARLDIFDSFDVGNWNVLVWVHNVRSLTRTREMFAELATTEWISMYLREVKV